MVKKWLRLNFFPRNPWGFKITAAIERAVEVGKFSAVPQEIGQLNLHITTRIDMLKRVTTRIANESMELARIVSQHGHEYVFTSEHEAYAFTINEDLKHNLLVDIDSFLFECNACCELITKLLTTACKHIGQPIPKKDIGKTMSLILKKADKDIRWFVLLDNSRNTFAHNATPYAAVDISEEENNRYDLLIMQENIKTFEDKEKFIRLSDFPKILQGFMQSLPIIETYIADLYAL